MPRLLALLAALVLVLAPALAPAQPVTPPVGTAALVCAYNSVVPAPTSGQFAYVQCDSTGKLITTSSGGGSGNVTGPGSSTTGDVATFADTTGQLLADTAVTGTGNVVKATAPTIASPTITTAFTATGLVTNADLANPATTVNGQTCTLGSTCTISAAASLINGSSTISGGAANQFLIDSGPGTLGESTGITTPGTGQLALATGTITTSLPALSITQTWNAGAVVFNAAIINATLAAEAAGSSLLTLQNAGTNKFAFVPSIGGAANYMSIGANQSIFGGFSAADALMVSGGTVAAANAFFEVSGAHAGVGSGMDLGFSSSSAFGNAHDTVLTRSAAATLHQGLADAAAPVAQTLGVQSVVGGTSNTASPNWTLIASLPTGSGTPGDIIWQTGFQGVAATATITFSDSAAGANTCTVNWTANGLSANQAFTFSGGTAPTGSTAGTTYYVLTPGTNSFTCSATPGGTILAITTNGSGTITGITSTAQEPPITAVTIKGGTQQVNFVQPFQTAASSTGVGTETFTNSPCTGLTTEQWVPVKISGQSGTWFLPACQ